MRFAPGPGRVEARLFVALILGMLCNLAYCGHPVDAVATVSFMGTARPLLAIALSSGTPGASVAVDLSGATSGVTVTTSSSSGGDSSSSIDFGDLSRGDGTPATASVSLNIWSNCRYKVTASRTEYRATNLQFNGEDVSGTTNGGSFLTMAAPSGITATGPDANPGGSTIASRLSGPGMPLSELSSGPATASSTVIASGDRACRRGALFSPSNALMLPISFSCPTGLELAPIDGSSPGSFHARVEFTVYPGD